MRRLLHTVKWKSSPIPAGYTQLNYIQNLTGGYVNLWIRASNDIEVWTRAYVLALSTSFYFLQSRTTSSWAIYGISWSQNGSMIQLNFGPNYIFRSETVVRDVDSNYDFHFKCKNGVAQFDFQREEDGASDNVGGAYTWSAPTSDMRLFWNASWNRLYQWHRVYYVKIQKSWVTVLDWLPCKRDSDGVYGLYNIVNGEFLEWVNLTGE